MNESLLSVREACSLLKISKRKFYDLVRSGQVKAVRIGRALRFERNELSRFIRRASA